MIAKAIKQQVRNFLKQRGLDIVFYPSDSKSRMIKLLSNYNINIVFDVGANIGQYAIELRNLGYKSKIHSFEPLSIAFEKLKKNSGSDPMWTVHNYALGDKNYKSEINIAGNFNSTSSSLLDMLPYHEEVAPKSKYIGTEEIDVKSIDSIFDDFCNPDDNIYLKIDTQGYEKNVLDGAINSLKRISTIQLEMSIMPLYKDELLFNEMYEVLFKKGYRMVSLESGVPDATTGQLLQVDGIFHRF